MVRYAKCWALLLVLLCPFRLSAEEVAPTLDLQTGFDRSRALSRIGAGDQAEKLLWQLAAENPENPEVWERLRAALVGSHGTDELPRVLGRLVSLRTAAGDLESARGALADLETLVPDHPDLPLLRQGIEAEVARRTKAHETPWTSRMRSAFGILVFIAIGYLVSTDRKRIQWRVVVWGMALQIVFAVLILWTAPGRFIFDAARIAIEKTLSFTNDGASFLFGKLYDGVPGAHGKPIQVLDGNTEGFVDLGLIFAFHILPTIVFFGALMSLLYHFGILQRVVGAIAWVMRRTMGTSGAESLSAAGNIFVGQTEAPLLIRPYVKDMTRSELMAVMTGGFATVAGGVLAAYVRFGLDAGHLLAASVMSAPAALVMAKLMVPETETPKTMNGDVKEDAPLSVNAVDAAARGASDGLHLALNVGAMLLAFIALIAMLNAGLGFVGLSLAKVFGILFAPLSYIMGVDPADVMAFGNVLGTKISINEFVAYVELGQMQATASPRTILIGTYALCGFANFASIGVQIGGIGAVAPERRGDLAKLGMRAMFAGAMASWLTACVAGILL